MLQQFLTELEDTFPEEKTFKKYHASFDIMRAANPRKCVDVFMNAISKHANLIMQKDDTLFDHFDELDIKKYWTPDLSQGTKDAIWQYLQTLNILGMTITSIPADMLSMVEGVAAKITDGFVNGGGGGGGPDMSSLTGLFGMLQNAVADPTKKLM